MTLLESVTHVCKRLAPGGWHSLMLAHGLDILSESLDTELARPLAVDRSVAGFEDFALDGIRGIEPAMPSRSLLYHALASPQVTVDGDGQALRLFPEASEIETVLDYVYSINPPTLEDLRQLAGTAPLAVLAFASEYRNAVDTVHGRHADLCFSRTGIARVGTAPALYDPALRSFVPVVEDDSYGIRVMPARYSAWIAMRLRGDEQRFVPMDFQAKIDADLDFWVPLHKLFNGSQCLTGMDLAVVLDNYQINEKLRQIHMRHRGTGWEEPEISQPPFVVTDGLAHWAPATDLGPGVLLPQVMPRLVEPVDYQGQPLSFCMPVGTGGMVHGRHRLNADGSIDDLNDLENVLELVDAGGYRTLHYRDGTADGWVRAHCQALEQFIPSVAAYSVIGPPDFFPFCTQRKLMDWANEQPAFPGPNIWHARLDALSNVRYCANQYLKDNLFSTQDRGVTAIVGLLDACDSPCLPQTALPVTRPSSLPDGAAGVFFPGWEVGRVRESDADGNVFDMLSGYHLASPFPEDVKICAAVGSFWPGVAPDSARVFERTYPTIIPLKDQETGGDGSIAWDGQQGPRLVSLESGLVAQYRAYAHTDYTQVALNGQYSLQQTGRISQADYQDRVMSMYRVYDVLGAGADRPMRNNWPLLSFIEVQRPDAELDIAQQQAGHSLNGRVYRFLMYKRGEVQVAPEDFKLRNVEVEQQVILLVSTEAILIKREASLWQLAIE